MAVSIVSRCNCYRRGQTTEQHDVHTQIFLHPSYCHSAILFPIFHFLSNVIMQHLRRLSLFFFICFGRRRPLNAKWLDANVHLQSLVCSVYSEDQFYFRSHEGYSGDMGDAHHPCVYAPTAITSLKPSVELKHLEQISHQMISVSLSLSLSLSLALSPV